MVAVHHSLDPRGPEAQRLELRESVAKLALSIDAGVCDEPSVEELEALALACDHYYLHPEAARIRRWMGRVGFERGKST